MSKLTAKERNALPASDFALPKERKYPIEDASHRANAKSRASEMEGKGKISKTTEEKINRKAGGARSGGHHNVTNPASHAGKMKHC